jgi:Zn-dependent protease with chaperone function
MTGYEWAALFLALFLVVAGWVMNPGNSRKLLLPLAGVAIGLIAAELFLHWSRWF